MSPVTFRPAKRENLPLLLGFAGGTGSGKTNSALRVATGLAAGAKFAMIDTEAGRGLHYADQFSFDHAVLEPPFRPGRYLEAIKTAEKAGYPVIVVDSMSHEWDGTGGMLDWHEEEMRGQEARKLTAWIKPKGEHRKFVAELLQLRAHLILCFRAQQKVEMVKVGGKWEIVPKQARTGLDGWIPICEKSLPFELTLSLLLTADQPGVPHPIKLQEQHRLFVPLDAPLTEQTGVALARWAAGKPASSGGGRNRRGHAAADPEPDPGLEAERDRLVGEIFELAVNDEKRAEMAEKIAAQRAKQDDPGAHLAWLGAQHERLQQLAAKRDQEQLDL